MKKTLIAPIIVILLVLTVFGLVGCRTPQFQRKLTEKEHEELVERQQVIKAKVIAIQSDESKVEDDYENAQPIRTLLFLSEIVEGEYKGVLMDSRQIIDPSGGYQIEAVEVGDRVFLYPYYDDAKHPIGEMAEHARSNPLIILAIVFAVTLVVFSGFKGLRSLMALTLTCLAIFYVFIPMVLKGMSPLWSATLACTLITIATLLIVYGFTIKTLSSAIGCLIGILTAGGIAAIMQGVMNLTGIMDEHTIILFFNYSFDMKGLLFAAIIIGALGATMDVAVSIASSLEEIIAKVQTPLSRSSIIASGMKIGGDIMGTMTNTLILAYVGSALPVILLLALSFKQPEYAISWEMISTEFLRALSGSIGLICVVPATSVVTALLHRKSEECTEDQPEEPTETESKEEMNQ